MAVFYKWIKGCTSGADITSGLWTYLQWGGENQTEVTGTVVDLPKITILKGKNDTFTGLENSVNNLGYILTNRVSGVQIESDWKFNHTKKLNFNDRANFYTSGDTTFYLDVDDWTINDASNSNATFMHLWGGSTNKIEFGSSYPVEVNSTLKVVRNVSITDSTNSTSSTTGALQVTGGAGIGGSVYISKDCNAQWFNATSDVRSKENIQPATYNALDLINKLTVYTYNYKGNSEKVTGILAQDLLNTQPAEVSLVSNVNATGENGDYMSIKNDKLMFVLLKAIQEQQKEIEPLKELITQLKK